MALIDVKFIISGTEEPTPTTITLQFPKTAKITDFLGNTDLLKYTPRDRTPKFVYKKQIIKPDDTLESIGYNPQDEVAITVVYILSPPDMINYIFICVKPDGKEEIKSLMIDTKINFENLKRFIIDKFNVSDQFKLIADKRNITSTDDLFGIINTVPIIVDDSKVNPIKGGRRLSAKKRDTRRKQSRRQRRGYRRWH